MIIALLGPVSALADAELSFIIAANHNWKSKKSTTKYTVESSS